VWRAEFAGFKAFNVPEVTIAAGDRLRVDTILEVGQVTESSMSWRGPPHCSPTAPR